MKDRWVLPAWVVPAALLLLTSLTVFSQVRNANALVRVWIPWAEIGCLAMIMTPIVVAGGIDLSVGATTALCAVVLATLWQNYGWPIGWASAAALVVGALAGAFNGRLVVAGLSPLVATLATMAFYRGLAMALAGVDRVTGFPEAFRQWSVIGGVPLQFGLLALTTLGAFVGLHHTPWGRGLFAMGDNRQTARFSGIPVQVLDQWVYTLSGLVAGLIAVVHTMQHNTVVGDAFQGMELQVIACVVVGGTLITGGAGGVLRTLIGLLAIAHLEIGLAMLSVTVRWLTPESRLIAIGLLVIGITVWNQRRHEWQLQVADHVDLETNAKDEP